MTVTSTLACNVSTTEYCAVWSTQESTAHKMKWFVWSSAQQHICVLLLVLSCLCYNIVWVSLMHIIGRSEKKQIWLTQESTSFRCLTSHFSIAPYHSCHQITFYLHQPFSVCFPFISFSPSRLSSYCPHPHTKLFLWSLASCPSVCKKKPIIAMVE